MYVGLNMFSTPGRPVAAEGRLSAVSWRADVMAGASLCPSPVSLVLPESILKINFM
jgi:hypothetical protein